MNSLEPAYWSDLRSPRNLYETPRWLAETESVIPGQPVVTAEFHDEALECLIVWRVLDSDDPSPYFNIGGLLTRLEVISRLKPGGWTLNCAGMEMHSQILMAPHIEMTPERLQNHMAVAIETQGSAPVMCGFNFLPSHPQQDVLDSLKTLGFEEVRGYRRAVLHIVGDSFQDYLSGLTRKQRGKVRNERRIYAESGCRTAVSCGPPALGDELVHLHRLNRLKHGGPADLQELRELHSRWSRCGGEGCVVIRTYVGNSCIGFSLFIRNGNTLHAMAAGFEEFNSKVGPYFENMYYAAVEWSYGNGVEEIDYGIGVTLAKSERGCRITEVPTWYRQRPHQSRLIVVGISPAGAKYFASAARRAGYVPVVVNKSDGYVGPSPMDCTYLHADIDDPTAVTTALKSQAHLLDGSTIITSPFDEVFPVLSAATGDLDVRSPDPVFAQLADKAFVSSLIPEFSPATLQIDPTQLPQQIPYVPAQELVFKPSSYTGGLGLRRFSRDAVTPAALREAISTSAVPNAGSQQWLLQEFIDGELISLEGYFHNGDLRVIGYSLRTRVGKTSSTNTFPGDRDLPAGVRARSEEAMRVLADRAKFLHGYFHAEFMITGDDVRLIDANMGRLSGAVLVEQFALAHGIDAGSIFVHSLLLPFEPNLESPPYKPASSLETTVAYLYGVQNGGVIRSVDVPPESPRCLHTRYVPDGQYVPPVNESGYTRVGMISGFREDCDAFIEQMRIWTDDGEQPAYFAK